MPRGARDLQPPWSTLPDLAASCQGEPGICNHPGASSLRLSWTRSRGKAEPCPCGTSGGPAEDRKPTKRWAAKQGAKGQAAELPPGPGGEPTEAFQALPISLANVLGLKANVSHAERGAPTLTVKAIHLTAAGARPEPPPSSSLRPRATSATVRK
jgi:hypothetical protein